MAKEDIHSYIKTIGLIGAIFIAVGVARTEITTTKGDVKVVQSDVKVLNQELHDLQLEQGNLINISKNTLNVLTGIQAALESLKGSVNTQGTSIALIQKDISNLELVE